MGLIAENAADQSTLRALVKGDFNSADTITDGEYTRVVFWVIAPNALDQIELHLSGVLGLATKAQELSNKLEQTRTNPPPAAKLPREIDDSVCSGHEEPTCDRCGKSLVNKKSHWECANCGATISMAQGIMARATEDDKQAD